MAKLHSVCLLLGYCPNCIHMGCPNNMQWGILLDKHTVSLLRVFHPLSLITQVKEWLVVLDNI